MLQFSSIVLTPVHVPPFASVTLLDRNFVLVPSLQDLEQSDQVPHVFHVQSTKVDLKILDIFSKRLQYIHYYAFMYVCISRNIAYRDRPARCNVAFQSVVLSSFQNHYLPVTLCEFSFAFRLHTL